MTDRHSSPVLQLQALATDSAQDITVLLRKALLIATKLDLTDFRDWIKRELQGYGRADVPDYRKVRARLQVQNPYHGPIPVIFHQQFVEDYFCNVELRVSVETLKHLLHEHESAAGDPVVPLTAVEMDLFFKDDSRIKLPPLRTVPINAIASILDSVRTTLLEWALHLESEGILGDGVGFSSDEKDKASSSSHIHIESFQGILGDVSDSSVSQRFELSVHKGDLASLERYLKSLGIEECDLVALRAALAKDASPGKPGALPQGVSSWIGTMVAKAASGGWKIAVGSAGTLLAQAISAYYGLG